VRQPMLSTPFPFVIDDDGGLHRARAGVALDMGTLDHGRRFPTPGGLGSHPDTQMNSARHCVRALSDEKKNSRIERVAVVLV